MLGDEKEGEYSTLVAGREKIICLGYDQQGLLKEYHHWFFPARAAAYFSLVSPELSQQLALFPTTM